MTARDTLLIMLGTMPAMAMGQAARPNIIYIMCDDMGYGDLGCYGQKLIATPNIDHMAETGMRFTQAYAGCPVSAPSRATFMTGQHVGHTHVRGNKEYWNSSNLDMRLGNNVDYHVIGQEPYDTSHKIIPEIFRERGYTTGMFGKWAGGYMDLEDYSRSSASTPEKRGIDDYYGYICQFQAHAYYPNMLQEYHRGRPGYEQGVRNVILEENILHGMGEDDPDYANRTQYSADMIHRKALEWLDERAREKDRPFLGIFTYTLPHAELYQPDDSILQRYSAIFPMDEEKRGGGNSRYHSITDGHAQFAAMITRLDAQVGEIMGKLHETGLDENTLVIFTSDNGPHEEGGADPSFFGRDGKLRGIKRSTYEGGIRIPFIAKGPRVPEGTVCSHQMAFYDLMPTFLEYAGFDPEPYSLEASVPSCRYDGISACPALTGDPGRQKEHEFLYWEFHETDMMGLRMGDWKLVVASGECRLYNLATDIHEDHDVSQENPDIVRQMVDIILREHVENDMFKVTLPARR